MELSTLVNKIESLILVLLLFFEKSQRRGKVLLGSFFNNTIFIQRKVKAKLIIKNITKTKNIGIKSKRHFDLWLLLILSHVL